MNTVKSKANELFEENVQLGEDILGLRLKWTEEIGKQELLKLLSVKQIESLNHRDWSSIRRINGFDQAQKRKELVIWRFRYKTQSLPRRSRKRLPRD